MKGGGFGRNGCKAWRWGTTCQPQSLKQVKRAKECASRRRKGTALSLWNVLVAVGCCYCHCFSHHGATRTFLIASSALCGPVVAGWSKSVVFCFPLRVCVCVCLFFFFLSCAMLCFFVSLSLSPLFLQNSKKKRGGERCCEVTA